MNSLSLLVSAVLMALTQALTFSTLASVSLTLLSLNKPVHGFFGMFRRRSSPVQSLIEEVAPEGPIGGFADSDFQRRMNMFGSSGGFFSGFPNIPGSFLQNGYRPIWPSMPQTVYRPSESIPPQFQPVTESDLQFGNERAERASNPPINTEEAESFFTLLAETDENKCISRLVCELGAEPEGAGELGSTINEIIGSLTDFPVGSKVSEYNKVLQSGRNQGLSFCLSQFSNCDEESYMLMKEPQAEQTTETMTAS